MDSRLEAYDFSKGVRGKYYALATSDMEQVPPLVAGLYQTTNKLNSLFPGRPFTLDGHLVGSIGEIVAAYVYEIDLHPPSKRHSDGSMIDGRSVQIKLTGNSKSGFGFRWSDACSLSDAPNLLVAMTLTAGKGFEEIYAGSFPIDLLLNRKNASNGQLRISVSRLKSLNVHTMRHHRSMAEFNRHFEVNV